MVVLFAILRWLNAHDALRVVLRATAASSLTTTCFLVFLMVSLVGCGNRETPSVADEHAHHDAHAHHDEGHDHHDDEDDVPITEADVDMPRDFATAVARIDGYRQQVFEAIDAGKPTKAHRPLDEMDLVIGRLMPLARDSGVPRTEWEEVNLARREVRAQFDGLHESIDHGETPDLDAARQPILAAFERLQAAAQRLSSKPSTAELEKRAAGEVEERR